MKSKFKGKHKEGKIYIKVVDKTIVKDSFKYSEDEVREKGK